MQHIAPSLQNDQGFDGKRRTILERETASDSHGSDVCDRKPGASCQLDPEPTTKQHDRQQQKRYLPVPHWAEPIYFASLDFWLFYSKHQDLKLLKWPRLLRKKAMRLWRRANTRKPWRNTHSHSVKTPQRSRPTQTGKKWYQSLCCQMSGFLWLWKMNFKTGTVMDFRFDNACKSILLVGLSATCHWRCTKKLLATAMRLFDWIRPTLKLFTDVPRLTRNSK